MLEFPLFHEADGTMTLKKRRDTQPYLEQSSNRAPLQFVPFCRDAFAHLWHDDRKIVGTGTFRQL